jgi:hypothetical protein
VRIWPAALHHTEMVREVTALQVGVSSTAELVLGHLPGEMSRVDVVNELVAKFQRLEELCSWLEGLAHGSILAYRTASQSSPMG